MTITTTEPEAPLWTTAVAREIRKVMGARNLDMIDLDGIGGRHYMYWTRRIRTGQTILDLNDIQVLAEFFDKPFLSLFPADPQPSDYKGEVLQFRPTRRVGTHPRNRSALNTHPARPHKAA